MGEWRCNFFFILNFDTNRIEQKASHVVFLPWLILQNLTSKSAFHSILGFLCIGQVFGLRFRQFSRCSSHLFWQFFWQCTATVFPSPFLISALRYYHHSVFCYCSEEEHLCRLYSSQFSIYMFSVQIPIKTANDTWSILLQLCHRLVFPY